MFFIVLRSYSKPCLFYKFKHVSCQGRIFAKLEGLNSSSKRNFSSEFSSKSNGFYSYWRNLKWFSIPASVGFAFICSLQLHKIWKRERRVMTDGSPTDQLLPEWQVSVLSQLPFRVLSRIFGWSMDCYIPLWLRSPMYGLYVKQYNCNMEEAVNPSLIDYKNMQEFFTRKLKTNLRPISKESALVSPADGQIMEFGEISNSLLLEQVKGVNYPLERFLGPKHPFLKEIDDAKKDCKNFINSSDVKEQLSKGKKLFYCLVYLSPGDYHWFHAPWRWTITHRRHIPGTLFPVKPWALRSIQGVFNLNERVILSGHDNNGNSLMFGAVGAYNVGSIKLECEKNLDTNKRCPKDGYHDNTYGSGLCVEKGSPLGHFRFGSSIVLVFTAPKDFEFCVEKGSTVKYGSTLGNSKDKHD